MQITIVGGGNIGTQFAVHCAEKQHEVTVYTREPSKFQRHLLVVDQEGRIIHEGDIKTATNDARIAFHDADVILVTRPSYAVQEVADEVVEYCNEKTKIGLMPGTGGGEWIFKKCIEKGAVVFGLQRVPSVARVIEVGKTVRAVGYRRELYVAALPHSRMAEVKTFIADIFNIDCIVLPNYLNITLTPSNPILHTVRLRTIFKDYKEGVSYKRLPLFYEDWNNETSELIFQCDEEVQLICRALRDVDLSWVKSLKEHYNSDTPDAMTRKIRSIEGFKGLRTPAVEVDDGYIPDLHSRYFTEDFPYGLEILCQIAQLIGVDVPNMNETLEWYYSIVPEGEKFRFRDYGVNDRSNLLKLYLENGESV